MGRKLTVRVELEHVDVAICVGDDKVQLFAVGEEIGSDDFDGVRRFTEESKLVGLFL